MSNSSPITLYVPRDGGLQTPLRSLLTPSTVGLLGQSDTSVVSRLQRVSDAAADALADLLFKDDAWKSCYVALLAMPDGRIEFSNVMGDSDFPAIEHSPSAPPADFVEAHCRATVVSFEKVREMVPQPDYMVVVLAARCRGGVIARYDFRTIGGCEVEVGEFAVPRAR